MNINRKLKILVVEDDTFIASYLKELLKNDFQVFHEDTLIKAEKIIAPRKFDLIILDINLPDGNGLDFLKKLRKEKNAISTPTIILTSHCEKENRIRALSNYCDAFIEKPFDERELVLWIKNLLKRKEHYEKDYENSNIISSKEINFDKKNNIISYRGEKIENLTQRESEILFALIKNSPRILSRKEIIEDIFQTFSVENLVDIHIYNLRKKIPKELSERIENIRGKGFRFL